MLLRRTPALTALLAHVTRHGVIDRSDLEYILERYTQEFPQMTVGAITESGVTVGDVIEVTRHGANTRRGVVIAHLNIDGSIRHLYQNDGRRYSVEAMPIPPPLNAHLVEVIEPLTMVKKGRTA